MDCEEDGENCAKRARHTDECTERVERICSFAENMAKTYPNHHVFEWLETPRTYVGLYAVIGDAENVRILDDGAPHEETWQTIADIKCGRYDAHVLLSNTLRRFHKMVRRGSLVSGLCHSIDFLSDVLFHELEKERVLAVFSPNMALLAVTPECRSAVVHWDMVEAQSALSMMGRCRELPYRL